MKMHRFCLNYINARHILYDCFNNHINKLLLFVIAFFDIYIIKHMQDSPRGYSNCNSFSIQTYF